eukprot:TRINITY_DN14645_c0_g1_i7.p1 TRINITY_DN14645_c0_g1~~TRINITY_DN14645_c0_g1_i7.p1  ORF type:complete len:230 (+),score=-18.93 TRINITY_DN14645_c0_g1_i7:308-997(+)
MHYGEDRYFSFKQTPKVLRKGSNNIYLIITRCFCHCEIYYHTSPRYVSLSLNIPTHFLFRVVSSQFLFVIQITYLAFSPFCHLVAPNLRRILLAYFQHPKEQSEQLNSNKHHQKIFDNIKPIFYFFMIWVINSVFHFLHHSVQINKHSDCQYSQRQPRQSKKQQEQYLTTLVTTRRNKADQGSKYLQYANHQHSIQRQGFRRCFQPQRQPYYRQTCKQIKAQQHPQRDS